MEGETSGLWNVKTSQIRLIKKMNFRSYTSHSLLQFISEEYVHGCLYKDTHQVCFFERQELPVACGDPAQLGLCSKLYMYMVFRDPVRVPSPLVFNHTEVWWVLAAFRHLCSKPLHVNSNCHMTSFLRI